MRMCSIASGSSGNCIYVGSCRTHLLVDIGISRKRAEEGLTKLGVKGGELTGVLITHEHSDHIQGLGVFCRKYAVPVYATQGTIKGIRECLSLGELPEGIFHTIHIDERFTLGDITIDPFRLSHDANEPSGFKFSCGGKAAAIATDMGGYDGYTVGKLKELDAVFLEANHDIHMLEAGPYPYPLKLRIMGEKGHLSNELSGRLLCDILNDNLKHVMLGHLSRENNYDRLAYETVKLEIILSGNNFDGGTLDVKVAKKDEMSEIIEI